MKTLNKLIFLLSPFLFIACSKFLEVKPDKQMIVPTTLEHCDALLNDYSTLNTKYPTLGEIGTDDYYVKTADWKSITVIDDRNAYLWSDEPIVLSVQWQNLYKSVYQCNQILDIADGISRTAKNQALHDNISGAAYFYRGFNFSQLITTYCLPYNEHTAATTSGIPLRLDPSMDYSSRRATLQESYEQVISDFKKAVQLLTVQKGDKVRPARAAAYAALARIYLDMQFYENAFLYADSSLAIDQSLMDFNTLAVSASLPIPKFNKEVLFPAITPPSNPMGISFAKIDSFLYQSYDENDLRKKAYFRTNTGSNAGTYAFKGSYDNSNSVSFVGLTTSEMLLVRAEAAARTNRVVIAKQDINRLLQHRYETDEAPEVTENDPDLLLSFILQERRKELLFRGRRWADLKRLNQDPRFAKTIVHIIDGKEYRLEPNSLKYAIQIPQAVIDETGMPQNKR